MAGLVGVVSSSAYTLDSSPPDVGVVYDGPPPTSGGGRDMDYWTEGGVVEAHWRGFSDPHSGIAEYGWALGTCPHCTDIQPFISVGANQGKHIQDFVYILQG